MYQLDKNPNIAKTDFLRALRIMHAEFIFWGRAPEIDINRIACRPLSLSQSHYALGRACTQIRFL